MAAFTPKETIDLVLDHLSKTESVFQLLMTFEEDDNLVFDNEVQDKVFNGFAELREAQRALHKIAVKLS
jgi:hypothetical protein